MSSAASLGVLSDAASVIGGMTVAEFVGYGLDVSNGSAPIFLVAGGAHLLALLALHLISPRSAPTSAGLATELNP